MNAVKVRSPPSYQHLSRVPDVEKLSITLRNVSFGSVQNVAALIPIIERYVSHQTGPIFPPVPNPGSSRQINTLLGKKILRRAE